MVPKIRLMAGLLALALPAGPALAQEQVNDPNFVPRVERPAFASRHPRVGIDEAHRNFHTLNGRYQPFASLIMADGFAVSAAPALAESALKAVDILVIANAMGEAKDGVIASAFTVAECEAVEGWVRAGGSLLLIADHAPWGDASVALAQRFGVRMGRGFVMDAKHADGNPTKLVFSADNGLLGDHPIIRGRDRSEQVRKVVAFTGQSLTVPTGATPLLKISSDATESFDPQDQLKVAAGQPVGTRLHGRAQAIAMPYGKGRVVMLGEAAMFSAQVATLDGQTFKAGMNVPGNDDQQFALNVMRWLARSPH